jgi:hypothetical protein
MLSMEHTFIFGMQHTAVRNTVFALRFNGATFSVPYTRGFACCCCRYFCVAAGLGQSTGLTINAPPTWLQLLVNDGAWSKLVVTLLGSMAIAYALRVWKSPAALPTVMLLLPMVWCVVLAVTCAVRGTSWGSMQHWLVDNNWISPLPEKGISQSVLEVRSVQWDCA